MTVRDRSPLAPSKLHAAHGHRRLHGVVQNDTFASAVARAQAPARSATAGHPLEVEREEREAGQRRAEERRRQYAVSVKQRLGAWWEKENPQPWDGMRGEPLRPPQAYNMLDQYAQATLWGQ